jgi:TRAP-type C4-dicarboxylate transport system substrate-binding protein
MTGRVSVLSAHCQLFAIVGAAALLLGGGRSAGADPVTLRLASVAPDGTAWAREFRAFGREVAAATNDQVKIKWYMGGIAGDEMRQHERVQRDQLDGMISGGMLCQRLAPSMRALAVGGQLHSREEATYILSKLKPTIDDEMLKSGYVHVADSGLGFSVLFSRTPVRSMSDLKTLRPWIWSLDEVLLDQLAAMGLHPVGMAVDQAGHAYDDRKVDGFVAVPSAAMAFQWSAQARYISDLRVGFLMGCMMVARRAWDSIGHDDRQLVLAAAGKLAQRVDAVSRDMDDALLKTLFTRQGLTMVPASPALQLEFNESLRAGQKALGKLVPPGMAERVAGWLAEYRGHRASRR